MLLLLWERDPAAAQEFHPLAYPQRAELALLAPLGSDGLSPSVRATFQRRLTLRTSAAGSGLLLVNPLSRTFGLTAGGVYALDVGPLLVEPFAEFGFGWVDGRVEDGSYDVWSGSGIRHVERYRVVTKWAPLAGAGVSVAAVAGQRLVARLTAGWWHGSAGDVEVGGLRVGVSLGLTRPRHRWYEHRTDRTPPTVALAGSDTADAYSIEVTDRPLRIYAGDASGVAEVRVRGEPVAFTKLSAGAARSMGLPEHAVVAEFPMAVPPGGAILPVVVRDSGQQTRSKRVHVVGPPDRTPPTLELLPPANPDRPLSLVRVWAEDPTGIVDGRIGTCPVRAIPVVRGSAGSGGTGVDDVGTAGALLEGPAAQDDSVIVTARDQAGNEARLVAPVPVVRRGSDSPLILGDVSARPTATAGGQSSVRVRGEVLDLAGLGVARVRLNGRPVALRGQEPAVFEGWLVLGRGQTVVTVEASTLDGRRLEETVRIGEPAPTPAGRLRMVMIDPDTTARPTGDLERLGLAEGPALTVLRGPDLTVSQVENALIDMAVRLGPGDVALLHLAGALLTPQLRESNGRAIVPPADPSRSGPLVALADGSLDLQQLGQHVRGFRGAAVLVSTDFRTTRGWGAKPQLSPGALPPPGCVTMDGERRAGVADLGGAPLDQVLRGLAGSADLDGDGRVRVGELMEWLGVAPSGGALPYDPFAVATEVER